MSPDPTKDAPDFKAGHVLEAKTGGYLVQSKSTPGVWYLVAGRSCSCRAGRAGNERCWHRDAVQKFCRMLDESMKRPRGDDTSEAVVSRFVD